jgi:hypothetical protein
MLWFVILALVILAVFFLKKNSVNSSSSGDNRSPQRMFLSCLAIFYTFDAVRGWEQSDTATVDGAIELVRKLAATAGWNISEWELMAIFNNLTDEFASMASTDWFRRHMLNNPDLTPEEETQYVKDNMLTMGWAIASEGRKEDPGNWSKAYQLIEDIKSKNADRKVVTETHNL